MKRDEDHPYPLQRQKITDTIKDELEKKLNNSILPLQGYTDTVEWVRKMFALEINYHISQSFFRGISLVF